MRLTWKDGIATVLTAGIVALYAAYVADEKLPLVSGPRVLAGLILVVGLTACAIGGTAIAKDGSAGLTVYVGSTLGAAAFLAALITMITGAGSTLAILVGVTVALWLLATVRHAVARTTTSDRTPDHELAGHRP
jgi:hypothetical protein